MVLFFCVCFFDCRPTGLSCFQFLLSQAHRLQALELLGRFLDQGPWAVHLALAVGIFPYVLKLLGSKLRELQPILVFIWAKILAVDPVSARGGEQRGGERKGVEGRGVEGGAVFCLTEIERSFLCHIAVSVLWSFYSSLEGAMKLKYAPFCSP